MVSFAGSEWTNFVVDYNTSFTYPIARIAMTNTDVIGALTPDAAKLVRLSAVPEGESWPNTINLTVDAFAGSALGTMRQVLLPSDLNTESIQGLYELQVRFDGGDHFYPFYIGSVSTVSISSQISVSAKRVNPDAWTSTLTDSVILEDMDTYAMDWTIGGDVYTYASAGATDFLPYHGGAAEQGHLVGELNISGGHAPYTVSVYEADPTDGDAKSVDAIRVSADADAEGTDDVSKVYLYVRGDDDATDLHEVKLSVTDGNGRIVHYTFNFAFMRTPEATMATPAGIDTYKSGDSEGFLWGGSAVYPKRLTLNDTVAGSFAYTGSLEVQKKSNIDDGTPPYIEFGFIADGARDAAYSIASSEVTYTENGYDFPVAPPETTVLAVFYLFKPMAIVEDPKLTIVTADNVGTYTDNGAEILATTVAHTDDVQLELKFTGGFGAYTFLADSYEYEGASTTDPPLVLGAQDLITVTDTTATHTVTLGISNSNTKPWSEFLDEPGADGIHTTDSKRMRLAGLLTAGTDAGSVVDDTNKLSVNYIEVYPDFVTRVPSDYPYFPLFVDLGAADFTTLYDLGHLADNGAFGYGATTLTYTLGGTSSGDFAVSGDSGDILATNSTFSAPVYIPLTLQITDAVGTTAFDEAINADISFFTKPTLSGPESFTLESDGKTDSTEDGVAYYSWDVTGFTYAGGYIPSDGAPVARDELSLALVDDNGNVVNGAALDFVATEGFEKSGSTCSGKVVVKVLQDDSLWGKQRTLSLSFPAKSVTPEGDAQPLWTEGSYSVTLTFVNASWQLTSTDNTVGGVGTALATSGDLLMTNHANADMVDTYDDFEADSLFVYGDDTVFDTVSEFTLDLTSLEATTVGYKIAVVKVTDDTYNMAATVGANLSVAMSRIDYDNIDNYADSNFTFYENPATDSANRGSLIVSSSTVDVDGSVLRIVMDTVPAQNTRYLFMLVSAKANITGASGAFQRRILINRFDDVVAGTALTVNAASATYLDRIGLTLGGIAGDETGEDVIEVDARLQASTSVIEITNIVAGGAGNLNSQLTVAAHGRTAGDLVSIYGTDMAAYNVQDVEVLSVVNDDTLVVDIDITGTLPTDYGYLVASWATIATTTAMPSDLYGEGGILTVLPERYSDASTDDGTHLNSNLDIALNAIHYRLQMRNAIGQVEYVNSAIYSGRDTAVFNTSASIEDRHHPIGPYHRETLCDDGTVFAELTIQSFDFGTEGTVYGFTSAVTELKSGLIGTSDDIPAGSIGD